MTPKEKAKYLVNKHYSLITGMELSYVSKLIYLPSGDSNYEIAKQCTLVSIDEVIANIEPSVSMDVISARIKYWEQVKQEIKNI
jgi:hypothetical protein